MNIQLIVQLLVVIGEAKTTADVARELEGPLSAYGLDHYVVLARDQDAYVPLLSSWPEDGASLYQDRHYGLANLSRRISGPVQSHFRWSDLHRALKKDAHKRRIQRMVQDAARAGLKDGYTFAVHGRLGPVGMMIAAGQPTDLSPAELALFEAAAKAVLRRLMELETGGQRLDPDDRALPQLTRREAEVISLLSNGLTSNEIAQSLDISAHTVDWYINGLQAKLEAKNRQHVVASAFRLGLLS